MNAAHYNILLTQLLIALSIDLEVGERLLRHKKVGIRHGYYRVRYIIEIVFSKRHLYGAWRARRVQASSLRAALGM